ncbi:MAG: ATP-binding protein [Pirellulaceae bacterium]
MLSARGTPERLSSPHALSHLELVAGSLNGLLEQVLDFFEAEARSRKVEVLRYLEADLPSVQMDKQTLQAALTNMVKNALEAMPEGGQLVVRTRMTRTGVAVDLIDTGQGIDSPTLLNMFEPFYTTKDAGSGLGLPMAKKVIEAHGGVIHVQSEVGRGTQFTLEFPTPRRL